MKKKFNKSKFNLIIDIIMLVVLMAVAGIGFMIKYVLVAGYKRNEIYGKETELLYLGLDRHQWGNVHLILSFVLLFLLFIHIIFHWRQIKCIFNSIFVTKIWRVSFVSFIIILSFLFGVMPLFVNPEINKVTISTQNNQYNNKKRSENSYNQKQDIAQNTISAKNKNTSINNKRHKNKSDIEIYGYMTLNEVAIKYDISANLLAEYINVPKGNNNEKIGRLKKRYDFQLHDLRRFIENHKSLS